MKLDKIKPMWEKHAKETLELQLISGTIYAFGSELACLRLDKTYRSHGAKADSGFSVNLNSWYFRWEII